MLCGAIRALSEFVAEAAMPAFPFFVPP